MPLKAFSRWKNMRSPAKAGCACARVSWASLSSLDIYGFVVPWIVERELQTQFAGMVAKLSRDYYHATNWAPDDVRPALLQKLERLDDYAKSATEIMGRGVSERLSRLQAVRAMPSAVADEAFADYFKGDPPFRSVKSR